MDIKELRDLLSKRLYIELQLFKDSKLRQEKEDIFKSSYEIEIYVNLYEVLLAYLGDLQENAIRGLLNLKFGILEFLYQEWLTREDGFLDELRAYACSEMETVPELGNEADRKVSGGKEPCGKESDV